MAIDCDRCGREMNSQWNEDGECEDCAGRQT
jgi:DNA-directed RNA polymerase subunit RPC12/RpoP